MMEGRRAGEYLRVGEKKEAMCGNDAPYPPKGKECHDEADIGAVCGKDAEDAPVIEAADADRAGTDMFRDQDAGDDVAADYEEYGNADVAGAVCGIKKGRGEPGEYRPDHGRVRESGKGGGECGIEAE